jgi:hypothetical protein
MVMNVHPLMAIVPANVLCIQLPKYHDNDDPIIHISQLTKVCVTNGENTNDHTNFNIFQILLEGKLLISLLGMRTAYSATTWDEV